MALYGLVKKTEKLTSFLMLSLLIGALTLCNLMDFPIHDDTIYMGLPIVYFKGSQVAFSKS